MLKVLNIIDLFKVNYYFEMEGIVDKNNTHVYIYMYISLCVFVCVTLQQGDGFGLLKATMEAPCGSRWG